MDTDANALPRNLNRTIIRMALPAMAESILITLVLFVDTVLVGWLRDPAALGAVAPCREYSWRSASVERR
jgi:Na+-driven multidrug efflux pump